MVDLAIAWCVERRSLVHALGSPRVHSGNLNEQFWLRIDGYRTIIW
jgi:hypothetical protein